MAFPFYLTLREIFPDNPKVLIGRKWISSLKPEDIFEEIITMDKKDPGKKENEILNSYSFSIGITLSPSFRSALLLKKLNIPLRIGYKTDFRRSLLKYPAPRGALRVPPFSSHEHRSLSYIRLLTPFFPENYLAENYFNESAEYQWPFKFSKKDKEKIQKLEKQYNIKKNYVVVCPGSVAPSKVYPIPALVEIIEEILSREISTQVLLVGTSIEKPYARQIYQGLADNYDKQVIDLTEKTTLKQVLHFLGKARAVIANDSGVAHMTSLTHTPLVSFQGMGRKEETLPLNPQKKILHSHPSCSPCMKKTCPRITNKLKCLKNIPPDAVIQSLRELILS